MTAADKVRFLAERCMGWKIYPGKSPISGTVIPDALCFDCGNDFYHTYPLTWTPLTSIADAFECQAKLPIDKYAAFVSALRTECGISYPISAFGQSDLFLIANATAEQRSNAIIRTLGGNPDE